MASVFEAPRAALKPVLSQIGPGLFVCMSRSCIATSIRNFARDAMAPTSNGIHERGRFLGSTKRMVTGRRASLLWNRSLAGSKSACWVPVSPRSRLKVLVGSCYRSTSDSLSLMPCRITSPQNCPTEIAGNIFGSSKNCKDKGTVAQELNWSQLTRCNGKFRSVCRCSRDFDLYPITVTRSHDASYSFGRPLTILDQSRNSIYLLMSSFASRRFRRG